MVLSTLRRSTDGKGPGVFNSLPSFAYHNHQGYSERLCADPGKPFHTSPLLHLEHVIASMHI